MEGAIRNAIEAQSDFVLIFISLESINSKWVKRELEWALEREKDYRRTFVFPIVLDVRAWEMIEPAEFRDRKYLLCTEFSESGVKAFAERLKEELFAWISRRVEDSDRKDAPKIVIDTVGVGLPSDAIENLRKQGAPRKVIKEAREMLSGMPEHALVVRARNEGSRPVLIDGYGVHCRQGGKRVYTHHPYAPTIDAAPLIEFEPGDYHEFIIDLEKLAKELQSDLFQYRGKAEIRGFYTTYDHVEYRSSLVTLDLATLKLKWD